MKLYYLYLAVLGSLAASLSAQPMIVHPPEIQCDVHEVETLPDILAFIPVAEPAGDPPPVTRCAETPVAGHNEGKATASEGSGSTSSGWTQSTLESWLYKFTANEEGLVIQISGSASATCEVSARLDGVGTATAAAESKATVKYAGKTVVAETDAAIGVAAGSPEEIGVSIGSNGTEAGVSFTYTAATGENQIGSDSGVDSGTPLITSTATVTYAITTSGNITIHSNSDGDTGSGEANAVGKALGVVTASLIEPPPQ